LVASQYVDGALANICWDPSAKESISKSVGHHVHSFYEIVYIEFGKGSHVINGETVAVGTGDLALFAPGTAHDPTSLEGARIWVMAFNFLALDDRGWPGAIHTEKNNGLGPAQSLLRTLHTCDSRVLTFHIPPKKRHEISRGLTYIKNENKWRAVGWRELVNGHLTAILVALLRLKQEELTAGEVSTHPLLAKTMAFIDTNFRQPIELRDIARHVDRSPAYLTHFIKHLTGLTAIAWLSNRRLTEARNLLLTGNCTVSQIAEKIGYDSPRHFSRMFKRSYGSAPMQWRKQIVA
jgi:AraC-like DNA-binding protein